jgi:hypothetical protein
MNGHTPKFVMPGPVPGSTSFFFDAKQDLDGRDKPAMTVAILRGNSHDPR